MSPRLRCPACGANGLPIARLVGYPHPAGHAALARGDAEVAAGCTDTDAGPTMPLRCRACRRLLADSAAVPPELAALALGTDDPVAAGPDGLYGRADGRGVVWVGPLLTRGAEAAQPAADARSLLRGVRRPAVVLRVEGVAARFAAGRDLRAALRLADPIVVSDHDPLTGWCGGLPLALTTRPRRVR